MSKEMNEPCCAPLCCEPLTDDAAVMMSERLKALAEPTRLRMFSLISSRDEYCACDLTEPLGIGQPTVSHHLKILHEAGLITREQRGKWAFYAVDSDALAELSNFLDPEVTPKTPERV